MMLHFLSIYLFSYCSFSYAFPVLERILPNLPEPSSLLNASATFEDRYLEGFNAAVQLQPQARMMLIQASINPPSASVDSIDEIAITFKLSNDRYWGIHSSRSRHIPWSIFPANQQLDHRGYPVYPHTIEITMVEANQLVQARHREPVLWSEVDLLDANHTPPPLDTEVFYRFITMDRLTTYYVGAESRRIAVMSLAGLPEGHEVDLLAVV